VSIHTLHIEHVMLLAIYSLLTLANSLLYRHVKGIHWFTLYNLFALLGAIAVELRGQIPDLLSIVGGNVLVVAAYMLLFFSLAALAERSIRQTYVQFALLAAAIVTMMQWGYFHPDTKTRLIAYSAILYFQQIQIAFFIWFARRGKLRKVGGPLAVMLAALAIINVIRILGVYLNGAPQDYLQSGSFLAWIVVANTCLQCGAMVSYVWMTASILRNELELQASTDPLTGLLNRRAVQIAARREIALSKQKGFILSVVTIDLDTFKQINDTYGHSCGDATLIAVAGCLQRGMRPADFLARTGGDEFTILLPRTQLASAEGIAERLRQSVQALTIPHGDIEIRITASFGLSAIDTSVADWDDLVNSSDKALYKAKRAGGNVTLSNTPQASRIAS
jgi:diguanylate cyclase (GGDEF)-like protein